MTALPFWIAGAGIFSSLVGFFAVGTKENASQHDLLFALHKGTLTSSVFVIGFCAVICNFLFEGREEEGWKIFGCIIIGLVAGVLM